MPTARTGRSPAAHEPVDRVRSTPPAGPPQLPFFRSRTQEDPIKRWAATHAEFRAALKVGKEAADQRVERSLYQRAVGYHYDAVKTFMPAGAKKPVYAPYVEHVPPDVTAQIFWLKNRDPALARRLAGRARHR